MCVVAEAENVGFFSVNKYARQLFHCESFFWSNRSRFSTDFAKTLHLAKRRAQMRASRL
jgi:hypothetical protein